MGKGKRIGILLIFIIIVIVAIGTCNVNNPTDEETDIYYKINTCLSEQVPEIESWYKYVEQASGGEAYLYEIYASETVPVYRDGERGEYLGEYYSIYVGEMWEDHSVVWDYFYVSEDFDEVLWCDRWRFSWSEHEVYTLEEWRACPLYRGEVK